MTVNSPDLERLAALVQEWAPFADFVPHFRTRREAARYFAVAYAARFGPRVTDTHCVVCQEPSPAARVTYRWSADFFDGFGFGALDAVKLALGHIGVQIKKEFVEFETTHPVCSDCAKRLRRRRWGANVLNFIGLFVTIVAGVCASIAWSACVYFRDDRPSDRQDYLLAAGATTAVLLLGLACLWAMTLLRVPAAVQFLARRPFRYCSSKLLLSAR